MASTSTPTPRRRPAGEVRRLLLENSRHVFASKGYAGASTRELAARAGVAETLLFRHFGSKAGLFREAIIEPFRQLVDAFVDQWSAFEPGTLPPEALVGDLIGSLYDALRDHRDVVVALVAAHAFDADAAAGGDPVTSALTEPVKRLEDFARREADARGLDWDAAIRVRSVVGMVMAMAVLDDWFFAGRRPSRAAVVGDMTRLVLRGLE